MSLEHDIRLFLAQANTPAGNWIYYTSAPADAESNFVTIHKTQDDAQHTTDGNPGHRTYATLQILCSVKGSDVYSQYEAATALSEAVKTALNTIGAPDVNNRPTYPATVGNTLIYFCSIDSKADTQVTEGVKANAYQYQKGAGSGIQAINVPFQVHYWNPNS